MVTQPADIGFQLSLLCIAFTGAPPQRQAEELERMLNAQVPVQQ